MTIISGYNSASKASISSIVRGDGEQHPASLSGDVDDKETMPGESIVLLRLARFDLGGVSGRPVVSGAGSKSTSRANRSIKGCKHWYLCGALL